MTNSVQGQAGSLVLTALTANAGYLLIALFEGAAESHACSAQREVRYNVCLEEQLDSERNFLQPSPPAHHLYVQLGL